MTPNVQWQTIRPFVEAHVLPATMVFTDDARHYKVAAKAFADHGFVAHSLGDYVSREDRSITTKLASPMRTTLAACGSVRH